MRTSFSCRREEFFGGATKSNHERPSAALHRSAATRKRRGITTKNPARPRFAQPQPKKKRENHETHEKIKILSDLLKFETHPVDLIDRKVSEENHRVDTIISNRISCMEDRGWKIKEMI